ncbi:hypothetical protein Aple_094420 [Acrocarpospora pleiomorpha]|uniref:Uncharacterized protein n=1 Tax=Acrocarpospora pleiomorpha TaxID=90975 RepID=A0A5M3Y3H4_9ACTN|nr:hypothetical protein [Acrocarpospora pleiomorpha]GES26543.1 hypothetical protein Aple_094420 [Acrocarpospora pleiomorpha]
MNKIVSRLGRGVALGAVMAFAGLGLAVTPANAAADTAVIAITKQPGNYFKVTIDVVIGMTEFQAQQLKNTGHPIVLRVWGEDKVSDNVLYGPDSFKAYDVTKRGIELHTYYYFKSGTTLNEDSGWFDDEVDDIYVGAHLLNPAGSTLRSVESNTVHGRF